MSRPIFQTLLLPAALVALVACEPEQEGTPLDPQETRQQEEPAAVENEGTAERDEAELHVAQGSIVSVDPSKQQVTINHARVESLGWPEMTMPFQTAGPELLEGVEPGMNVEFVFFEAPEGNYVIAEIRNTDKAR